MKAQATIAVVHDDGRDVVVDQRSSAPWSVRQCGERILLAASAAAPVGGDELQLTVDVGPQARADVGSVAATMVWPGPGGDSSSAVTECEVGAEGHLDLWLEPTISVAGSCHRTDTVVRLAPDATCRVVEEVALGRRDEPSGQLEVSLRVERDGRAVVHHAEAFGPDVPGAGSVVSTGTARHLITAVIVGPEAGESQVHLADASSAAWLRSASNVGVLLAVGPDRPAALAAAAVVSKHLVT